MVENICADGIFKCLEKNLSYDNNGVKRLLALSKMELPNADVVVSKDGVKCIDNHLSSLLKKVSLNKSSESNSAEESITSDDTIFSEDYILSAENDSDGDDLLVPKPKDIENALANLLASDADGDCCSIQTLENEETWDVNFTTIRNFHPPLTFQDSFSSITSENLRELRSELERPSLTDGEFDFVKQPIRRSTSLKSYKTPPDTPHHKKAVRFADALGLDLESVRHILDTENPPIIPSSAMKYLKNAILPGDNAQFMIGNRYLAACFPQPSSLPDYMSRLHDNKVLLESCVVDDREMTVTGTVRVVNLAFHKRVAVRYSFNEWLTHDEIAASYVHNSSDGPTDKFSFTIHVPSWVDTGNRVQFAVLYSVNGQSFWDNNYGCNYVIECYAKTMPMPGYDGDRTWVHFM